MRYILPILFLSLILGMTACNQADSKENSAKEIPEIRQQVNKYAPFKLTSDMSALSASEKQVIGLLIEAAKIIDDIFWEEAYGDKEEILAMAKDADTKRFVELNYGPWDRLDGNKPFVEGIGEKPAGANYYPKDMTKAEFEAASLPHKDGLYNFIRRDEKGALYTIPFHKYFEKQTKKVATLLQEAAGISECASFSQYLNLRAEALLNDEYFESDMHWMSMKDNHLDVVIGPIETYEDQLYGFKAAHECYILIKDQEWSKKLAKYAAFLPELQRNLPVPDEFKQEKPGTDADLNAYDVVYYAGDCNAGSKTIAINLPNDEKVQLEKGTRRLQLKNAMRAKYDNILVPIANELITEDQRKHITFDAFFSNTMFHEVAHGLGIKNVLNQKDLTVRQALKEHASALEEGKADILGLFMITQLHEKGEIEGDLKDYYVTFVASIFRSVRFGTSSAHGKANMIRFNFFRKYEAIEQEEDGTYRIDFDNMKEAMAALTLQILTLQGTGDYQGVENLVNTMGQTNPLLENSLKQLKDKNIPVDIYFEQGADVLKIK